MLLQKKRNFFLAAVIFLFSVNNTFAQEAASQTIVYTEKQQAMRITPDDIKLIEEKNAEGEITGYHLYIR